MAISHPVYDDYCEQAEMKSVIVNIKILHEDYDNNCNDKGIPNTQNLTEFLRKEQLAHGIHFSTYGSTYHRKIDRDIFYSIKNSLHGQQPKGQQSMTVVGVLSQLMTLLLYCLCCFFSENKICSKLPQS